jgi:hypothetical protein
MICLHDRVERPPARAIPERNDAIGVSNGPGIAQPAGAAIMCLSVRLASA